MERKTKILINFLYYGLIAVLLYGAIKFALPVFMPFVLALLVVALLRNPVRRLGQKVALPARPLLLLALTVFYLVLFGLAFLFGAKLLSALGGFLTQLPTLYQTTILPAIESVSDWVEELAAQFDPSLVTSVNTAFNDMAAGLNERISSFSTSAIGYVTDFLVGMPSFIISVVLMVVSSFYLASDYDRISKTVAQYMPEKWKTVLAGVQSKFKRSLGIYLRSYTLIFLLTWIELLIGLFLLRIPYALVISVLIALCDIMPVLGTGTVLIPWAIVAAILGYYPMAIGVGVLYLVITIVRNTVEPRLVGKQIGLHPLLTLIGMVVGLHLFGILGLFGVPVSLSILVQFHNGRQETAEPAKSEQRA